MVTPPLRGRRRLTSRMVALITVLAIVAAAAGAAVAARGGARPDRAVTRPSRPPGGATSRRVRVRADRPVAIVARPSSGAPSRPAIVARFIPFGSRRKAEMLAYARRHYGLNTYRLVDPHVIVEHYTVTPTFAATYNTFAPDVPDSELHELPGTCAHFVVDADGTIYQLVSLSIMCRHTVGLNWTAIGIEMVGTSDAQILHRPRQLDAALTLTRWLRCHFNIQVRNVIGHNESLSSPYHHERVAALRSQTHEDWVRTDMQTFRARLAALGGCG